MCCSLVQVNFPFELAEEALGHPSGSGFALSNSPRESHVCVTEIVDLHCKVQPFHGPAILPPCETSLMQPLGCETVQKIRTLGKDLSFAIHFAMVYAAFVFFYHKCKSPSRMFFEFLSGFDKTSTMPILWESSC